MRMLENTSNLTSKQLSRADSINAYLRKELSLERKKMAHKDSINANLEQVIKDYKKARKKEKLKNTFAYIGLGLVAGAEAGAIMYLILK